VRITRLDEVLESGRIRLVTAALTGLHGVQQPEEVRLRVPFVRSVVPIQPGQPGAPPASLLLSPNGQALRLYLLAVFVAHCLRVPGAAMPADRPLRREPGSTEPSWVDLFAATLSKPRPGVRTKERTGPATKIEKQLQNALRRLCALQLVELGPERSADRFDAFALVAETGRGSLATPEYYTVPAEPGGTLTIPSSFWLNGWLWALTNSEIAAYLMFRFLATAFPGEHRAAGVYIYGEDREGHFGLRRDAYESHILLDAFGLLEQQASPERDENNRIVGYKAGERYEALRFKLTDEGLAEDAVASVMARLENASRPGSGLNWARGL
jgi:hypothetical protein